MNIKSESEFGHGHFLYRLYWWGMLPLGIISAILGHWVWVYQNKTLGDVWAEGMIMKIMLFPWMVLAILLVMYCIFIVPMGVIAWLFSFA